MNQLATFNFAGLPGQRRIALNNPFGRLLIAILMLGGGLCLTGLWHIHSLMTASSALSESLQRAESSVRPTPSSPKTSAISKAQADAVNSAVHQLNVPWGDILDALEQATPQHVALLGIEPDSSRQLIRITGEAKTTDTMLAYLDRLNRSTFFVAASLTQHATNEQDPQKPLRFTVEAYYQDATMESRR